MLDNVSALGERGSFDVHLIGKSTFLVCVQVEQSRNIRRSFSTITEILLEWNTKRIHLESSLFLTNLVIEFYKVTVVILFDVDSLEKERKFET